MTINHHLDDATILAYAAGTLDPAISIVVASHIAWCPECRAEVRRAERIGGELVDGLDGELVSQNCRERTFASLGTAALHRLPVKTAHPGREELPYPLQRLLGPRGLEALNWKKKVPGISIADIPVSGGKSVLKVMSLAPGIAMPVHGHRGEEITMILKGAYSDEMGRFAKGDVADLDEDVEHKPVVERGETCICLIAEEAPARFKSIFARLLQPYFGI
ncbi:MAG: ChrR family anti-sigma-E factor [Aestuariivirga sp.]